MLSDVIKNYEKETNIVSTKNTDIIYVSIFTIALLGFFIYVDAFEFIIAFTSTHEDWELDEFFLLIIISGFSAHWYSYRRYKEMFTLQKRFENLNSSLEKQLSEEVKKSKKILLDKNKELEDEIEKTINETIKKDNILNQQSKMASMGEMLESIAHQWKQPLSIITTTSSGIRFKYELGILDKSELLDACKNVENNATYLAHTIDDFRDFFKKEKLKKSFYLYDVIDDTLKLINANFKHKSIEINKNIKSVKINGYYNELIQVLINIFNNSKDELITKSGTKLIFIDVSSNENEAIIKIKDNAGGISVDILEKVFEPYFTTKENKSGTGIGLYMTKRIIEESFHGTIEVYNTHYEHEKKGYIGAEFIIKLPLN